MYKELLTDLGFKVRRRREVSKYSFFSVDKGKSYLVTGTILKYHSYLKERHRPGI